MLDKGRSYDLSEITKAIAKDHSMEVNAVISQRYAVLCHLNSLAVECFGLRSTLDVGGYIPESRIKEFHQKIDQFLSDAKTKMFIIDDEP